MKANYFTNGLVGHGSLSSRLGKLNAAHASSKAVANAAPNSAVGSLREFEGTGGQEVDNEVNRLLEG